jgi:hypothetical protein
MTSNAWFVEITSSILAYSDFPFSKRGVFYHLGHSHYIIAQIRLANTQVRDSGFIERFTVCSLHPV